MKFNFKKITSVLASAVMLGSTIGIAAAANYPSPFVKGGSANVAVIVGAASPANVDLAAATDVAVSLQTELSRQTGSGTSTASGGDSVEIIGAGSTYLNLGYGLKDVFTTDIDKSNMPNLLADGTYRNADNTDYDYQQTITLGNLSLTHFADSDYNDKEPTIGFKLAKNDPILNYTLDFKKDAQATVAANAITGLENTDIMMLGKSYRIIDADNTTNSYLTMLGGSVEGVLNLNEEETKTFAGKEYSVKLVYVDDDEVQFDIDGVRTTKLNKGEVYKLSDGTNLGVKDLSYQNFAGGVMSAEYTLGAEKLKIEDGQKLEINDEDEDSITCYITEDITGSKFVLQEFTLEWVADDEYFITPGKDLAMPALNSVKLTMGSFYTPKQEVIKVVPDGSDSVELQVPLKDGTASFNILYGSDGVNWTVVGKDSTGRLSTVTMEENTLGQAAANKATTNVTFNETSDDWFIVSYNSTTAAESYLLSAKTTQSGGINYTTIKNEVTGKAICEDVQTARTCKIGNAVITVENNYNDDDAATFAAGTGVSFDRLYSAEGIEIRLPWLNESIINATALEFSSCVNAAGPAGTEVVAVTVFNNTATGTTTQNCYSNHGVYDLVMVEEDKDGNLGVGQAFNVTLGWSGAKTTVQSVSEMYMQGAQDFEIGNSDVFVGYIRSQLATKSEFDTGGTQDTVTYTYHGAQAYAPVFVAEPSVTVTTGDGSSTTLGEVNYYDNEIDSVKSKNLIVVGGSCINTVAAEILGGSYCGAQFTSSTGVGPDQFLVKVVDSPYKTTDQIAMLVAGYEAADTKKAVTYVTNEKPVTTVGTTLKKATATYADVA